MYCFILLFFVDRSHERTQEELELVFEELVHIAALSHLSTSIKRELASIIVFEAHAQAGTVCKFLSLVYFYLLFARRRSRLFQIPLRIDISFVCCI